MTDDPVRITPRSGVEMGYLKRTDLCNESHDVWEAPDGMLLVVPRGSRPQFYVYDAPRRRIGDEEPGR